MLDEKVIKYIDRSILCWLATTSSDYQPNVSPKEIFCLYNNKDLVIANIASPQSLKNIKSQPKVCVSFIDILEQKGYQLKGTATVINKGTFLFNEVSKPLADMTEGKYPFDNVFHISVESAKPIIAPSYLLFPEITQQERIDIAKRNYLLDQ